MSDPKLFVPCPACRGLSFVVVYEAQASLGALRDHIPVDPNLAHVVSRHARHALFPAGTALDLEVFAAERAILQAVEGFYVRVFDELLDLVNALSRHAIHLEASGVPASRRGAGLR